MLEYIEGVYMKITNSLILVCDSKEFSGVKKIAERVASDIKLVLGFDPILAYSDAVIEGPALLFGTVGQSAYIEELEKSYKLDFSKIRGKREVYGFFVVDNKIIITGSDKRGTIYGLFHLSELLGVSPLVDWADVLPAKKESFELENSSYISNEPSVRFRGFFINDEWPATGNWCNKRFGGFNTKMYEHVFELLLRMKGNYLWPAMWSARFSDDGPGLANAELADELGVVMGASHHEPCCRAGEEYRHLRGEGSVYGNAWNFRTNKEGITKFWEDGLKRNGKLENVITVGMRGEADTAIMQNATLKDNIDLLRDVLKTQNSLIKKYVNEDLDKVPRMLALYKEVEPYFYGDKHTKGLMDDPELEGVTLMLCDDNHGNLRTVPNEKMRSHNGGYGMYYHFDYHGSPYSFEWINTTALPKVKEQMTAAYDFGIQDLWIVNVGDVMTNEFPLNYFLDLAYDYEKYSADEYTTAKWTKEWIDFNFPTLSAENRQDVNFIINNYTKLAHMRRTECIQPDTYAVYTYGEGDKILALAEEVIAKAEGLRSFADKPEFTGLFAQVIYPALGNMNVLRMQLYSGKNKWLARHGAIAANVYADKVRECYAYDKNLVDEYDKVADGKFYAEGWSEHFGFKNWCEAESRYPTYTYVEPTRKGRLLVWAEGTERTTSGQDWTNRTIYIDTFKNPNAETARVFIANCCEKFVNYELSLKSGAFLTIDKETILTDKEGRIVLEALVIKVDRLKLAGTVLKNDILVIKGNDGHGAGIQVSVKIDADVPACDYPSGTYIQTGDYISINAGSFVKSVANSNGDAFKVLENYGKAYDAVKAYPVINSYPKGKNAPYVEYTFVPKKAGVYSFNCFLNPSNPAYKDNKLQFVAEVNGQKLLKDVVEPDFAVGDNQKPWSTDVTNNIRISSIYADCKEGINTIRIYPVTPNIVLEKIVISEANSILPDCYLGAPETYKVK